MLRRMDGWVASGFQGIDWDGAAALGRRGLMWFALAGTVFLLGRAQLPPPLAPFGMAFMAAALAAGKNGAALLAGCLAGAMEGGLADFNLRLPAGAAIVLGGGIAWDALSPALRRALSRGPWRRIGRAGSRDGTPPRACRPVRRIAGKALACSTLAGLGVLIPADGAGRGPLAPGGDGGGGLGGRRGGGALFPRGAGGAARQALADRRGAGGRVPALGLYARGPGGGFRPWRRCAWAARWPSC